MIQYDKKSDMTCHEAQHLMVPAWRETAGLASWVTDQERQALVSHVKGCRACKKEFNETCELMDMLLLCKDDIPSFNEFKTAQSSPPKAPQKRKYASIDESWNAFCKLCPDFAHMAKEIEPEKPTETQMDCHRAKELIPFYLAPHESWLRPEDRSALEAHLADCGSCHQEYEETRQAVSLFRQHGQISEDTQALLDEANLQDNEQSVTRTSSPLRVVTRIVSVAAIIIICLSIGLLFWAKNGGSGQKLVQNSTHTRSIAPDIAVTENGVPVSALGVIKTDHTQIRELIINSRHRLVMNSNTTLSVEALLTGDKLGYLLKLRFGQILAHVEHDGNPFEVHSPHGKAVITGTTFDIKVTEDETALVVAEGSVQFASVKGLVQVIEGQRSTLTAQSQPTEPTAYSADLLIAWATGSNAVPTIADFQADKLIQELQVSYPGQPIDLGSLNYDNWVESKRDWFKGQFPWIFDLQEALTTDNRLPATDVDYPELLIDSGDIWQMVYPHRFYRQIPVIDRDRFLGLAETYHLGSTWSDWAISRTRAQSQPTSPIFFGQEALNQWITQARQLETACGDPSKLNALCDYSTAIGEYMENTRALVWLCMQKGTLSIASDNEEVVLNLLKQQTTSAYHIRQAAWHLSQTDRSLEEAQIRKLITVIAAIQELEMQIDHTQATVNREP